MDREFEKETHDLQIQDKIFNLLLLTLQNDIVLCFWQWL